MWSIQSLEKAEPSAERELNVRPERLVYVETEYNHTVHVPGSREGEATFVCFPFFAIAFLILLYQL